MPFSLSVGHAADLVNRVPGVRAVHDVRLPTGRGPVFNAALSAAYRTRALDGMRPSLTLLEFG